MRRRPAIRTLGDLRPEVAGPPARIVLTTVEGPRFMPGDFHDQAELLADAVELFSGSVSQPLGLVEDTCAG